MMRILAIVLILAAAAVVALWQFGVVALPGASSLPAPNVVGEALWTAAENGDVEAANLALSEGTPVDAADPFGRTALMSAAAGGHHLLVLRLLEAGADPNAASATGRTPLMFAAESSPNALTPLLLLNAGADPHAADEEGLRALELAADNAAIRGSGLWGRLEELTAWPESLSALTDGDPYSTEWPSGYLVPIDGATVSSRTSHLPGALRAYRNGTHEGFDFYDGTVSVDIGYGTPQRAAAAGTVIRADADYEELTPESYEQLIDTATGTLSTPVDVLDALRGRQVWIRHAGGFVTRYAHLSGIAEGVAEGVQVAQGSTIGFTGNSGTREAATGTEEGPHPHIEIWRGEETYLGQDLEPGAIYARAAQVFGLEALPPFTESGHTF